MAADLPWRQIVSMRNVLVHGYAQVSDEDLWQTAKNDIRPLCERVRQYLDEIDWEKWKDLADPYTEIDNTAYKQAIDAANRMLLKGYALSEISEITGLTEDEIKPLSGKASPK